MKTIVTGSAGFIGYHVSKYLLNKGYEVIGVDNLNSYYDQKLKFSRNDELSKISSKTKGKFIFKKCNLEDSENLSNIFYEFKPIYVIHLAAQAGVRYSLTNPQAYISSNLEGFGNILECCRSSKINHLIYASSSSVYGGNTNLPFSETHNVDHPVSLYAATKKSNELMAHAYSHLFNIPTTGLRFFTVYGPWGRPDMALFLFTKAILSGEPIKIFNHGDMIRDFTYIDDIVESIFLIMQKIPKKNPNYLQGEENCHESWAPYKVFNIGNSKPINLMKYINEIEISLGIEAKKDYLPMQDGDVKATSANTELLEKWINYKPKTTVKEGIKKFVDWYKNYYE